MDKLRGDNSIALRYLLGGYAAAGIFPIWKKSRSNKINQLIRLSNAICAAQWLAIVSALVTMLLITS